MKRRSLFVTRPDLPPLTEILPLLEEIWESKMLSNNGPLAQRFEAALARYLGVEHLSLVANGFLGIVLALRQLGVTSGEVITTPFSFVATSHAIRWVGATPVFADIDPGTLNLDPEQVERHITPRTRAVLPVHIYGAPCDVSEFSDITRRHDIPVVYDAAHAFGIRHGTQSILNHGDMSVLSFHATKVFNTFEGGAVISGDRETKLAVDRLSNFGIVSEEQTDAIGLNAKMSEINAAIGLAQLSHVDDLILARKAISQRYQKHFKDVAGLRCLCPARDTAHNYYSFPIMLDGNYPESREELYARLKAHDINARRYYSPLISDLPVYNHLQSAHPSNLPVATRAASQILCLPMFPDLREAEQMEIIDLVRAQ